MLDSIGLGRYLDDERFGCTPGYGWCFSHQLQEIDRADGVWCVQSVRVQVGAAMEVEIEDCFRCALRSRNPEKLVYA